MSKTLKDLAKEMYDNLETKKRDNGKSFVCSKKEIEWQRDIIYNCHNLSVGNFLPNDCIYEVIKEVLAIFTYGEEECYDDLICEIEADIYTHDLLSWVSDNLNFKEYCNDAIENYQPKNIDDILSLAQANFKQEVANLLLQGLNDYQEGLE